MGGGGAEPDQAPPPMGGMGMGSNPPMNYGYQQPPQQNYYGGGGSGAPVPAFEVKVTAVESILIDVAPACSTPSLISILAASMFTFDVILNMDSIWIHKLICQIK